MRRKQRKGKRWTAMVLCISMCLAGVSGGNCYDKIKAETQETVGTEGEKPTIREKYMPYIKELKDGFHQQSNVGKNNYKTWSAPIQSYLQPLEDGAFQRVEGWNEEKKVVIEEYDKNLTKKKEQSISYELPLFGGYFYGEENQFFIYGQENTQEDDNCEVLRIVKYDKNWNRLAAVSVFGANTLEPFDAGSLRVAEANGKLFVHTCHTMYKSSDGKNHQANMTYVIEESGMEIIDQNYCVSNISTGYVSHSFNQFVVAQGEDLYRVDHGDAHPRALTITKCNQNAIDQCTSTNVLQIPGTVGDNHTGVSVGGFEKAGEQLLIAGNAAPLTSYGLWQQDAYRNVFLTTTSSDLQSTTVTWVTNYSASDGVTITTPHLVKADENRLYLIWEEQKQQNGNKTNCIKIATVDANGNQIGSTATFYGKLSDCKPVYTAEGKLCWYTAENSQMRYLVDEDEMEYKTYDYKEALLYEVDTNKLGEYQCADLNFNKVEIKLKQEEFTETADGQYNVEIEAEYEGCKLVQNRDYIVQVQQWVNWYTDDDSYSDIGKGTVRVYGIGYFSGVQSKNFQVKKRVIDIGTAEVSLADPDYIYYYSGKALQPGFILKVEGKTLDREEDYTVEYTNNTNAGEATATLRGKGNYTGTKTVTFQIQPLNIETSAKVTMKAGTCISDGKTEFVPDVTVKVGKKVLEENVEYTLSYENNINPGTAKAVITGIGNYTGKIEKEFEISASAKQSEATSETASEDVSESYGKKIKKGKKILWKLKTGDGYTVQNAIYYAQADKKHAYVIKVPKGTYKYDRCFSITGKNLTVDFTGVTYKRESYAGHFLSIGQTGKKYNGAKNITIKGGTFDNGTGSYSADLCVISHAENIKIKGSVFKFLPKKKLGASGGNAHMIETSAVNKLTIQNCKFYNNTNCKFNNEAIQMESNQNEKSMLAHAKIFTDRDGTTTKNVTIQGCYFQGFRYGCGSNHLSSKDTFTNMKFLNNTFVGATKYAICLYRYKGVKISGNKLKNSGSLYQNQHSTGISVGK